MTAGRRQAVAAAALLVVVAGGCASHGAGAGGEPPAATTTTSAPDGAAGGAAAARDFRSERGYRPAPVPVRIRIPRIGVTSTLDRLGRARDGTIEVPARWEVAGWYELGPRPGEPGSAVILGHVDSKRGPAVFFRLRQLRPGDGIEVAGADGSVVRFVVERTAQFDKRRFPTDEVYYPTLTPALRLVTCGGEFDTAAGHYRSNVIVFATRAGGPGP
jgi:sortase (surface protein transpeptidase)